MVLGGRSRDPVRRAHGAERALQPGSRGPMRTPIALVAAVLACGCQDLVTVEVGLDPIELTRELRVGVIPPDVCPSVNRDLAPTHALSGSATLEPVAERCALTIRLEGAVLMERATVDALRAQLEGTDTTALVGVVVQVREVELVDARGVPLTPADVAEIELRVDSVAVVPSTALDASLETTRVVLPHETVEELLAAVEERREARADLELRLVFTSSEAIPETFLARVVLAPALLVDVIRAVF